ncbi:phage related lysozyme [Parvularcula bermudensis HTCC2503]|uniref:Lysozyme n=1 Tax=Parvularcula bermudensis (strain ATCC BAA-594 / HTCC2503 / KCTC 12087) TaxID=314260 RepID=E0TGL6_PARBH|nr:lysozyme [Parvularcula bermudensis]ADM10148.1 phage related lysozyme [Parvularcula bermudensis HTCC2503]
MHISGEGIELIKAFEGLRLDVYDDGVGIWTIGYGHTGAIEVDGKRYSSVAAAYDDLGPFSISEAYAEDLLREDLQVFVAGVDRALKVTPTQSMFDALVSLAFNIGVSAFSKSTAVKRHNKRDFEGAAEAITWWNKAGGQVLTGLVRRRSAEAALYLRDVDELLDGGAVTSSAGKEAIEENSPRRSNPITTRTTAGAAAAGTAGAAGAGTVLLEDREKASGDGVTTKPVDEATPPAPPSTESEDATPSAPMDDPMDDNEASSASAPADQGGEDAPPAAEEAGQSDDTGTAAGEDVEGSPPPAASPPADATTEATEETTTTSFSDTVTESDLTDAIVIAAGILAVLAAIYVIGARIDDWRKWRR